MIENLADTDPPACKSPITMHGVLRSMANLPNAYATKEN